MKAFNELIALIRPELKAQGFTKSASTFYFRGADNWGLINFQKSTSSTSIEVKFTINMGIFSAALNNHYLYSSSAKPAMTSCHWQERIGHFLEPRHDKWWTVTEHTDIESLKREILRLINEIAMPFINTHISDAMLIAAWQKGETGGESTVRIREYLEVLQHKIGK